MKNKQEMTDEQLLALARKVEAWRELGLSGKGTPGSLLHFTDYRLASFYMDEPRFCLTVYHPSFGDEPQDTLRICLADVTFEDIDLIRSVLADIVPLAVGGKMSPSAAIDAIAADLEKYNPSIMKI